MTAQQLQKKIERLTKAREEAIAEAKHVLTALRSQRWNNMAASRRLLQPVTVKPPAPKADLQAWLDDVQKALEHEYERIYNAANDIEDSRAAAVEAAQDALEEALTCDAWCGPNALSYLDDMRAHLKGIGAPPEFSLFEQAISKIVKFTDEILDAQEALDAMDEEVRA